MGYDEAEQLFHESPEYKRALVYWLADNYSVCENCGQYNIEECACQYKCYQCGDQMPLELGKIGALCMRCDTP